MALISNILNNEKYAKYYHRFGAIYERPEIKASLEVIFSVFMVSILIFLAIRPTLTNLAALQKKIADKEATSIKADKKLAQLFSSTEQIETNSANLNLFDFAVPEKFSYFEILGRIENLAKTTGVEIGSLSTLGINLTGQGVSTGPWATKILKSDAGGMTLIPVDFQLLGSSEQIKKFLIEVENMDRLAVIKSVDLTKEEGSTKGTAKVKASGQISFYLYGNKK
jgi:hypothetical protein